MAATIESENSISAQITLLDNGGSQVIYGDLQLVPVGDALLYVRPLYVKSDAAPQATFQYVLVAYQGKAAFGENLAQALAKLFPGFGKDIGDVLGEAPEPTDPDQPTEPSTATPQELLAQADELFQQADEALPDFAKYDELNRQARNLVAEALAQLQDG